jgi:hypothetical protein
MAISRGRYLLSVFNPDPEDVRKSIAALTKDAEYVQKCMNAGIRDWMTGEATLKEINTIIEKLEKKL